MVEENTSPLSDYPSKPLVTEHLSIHSQDPLNTSVNSPLFQSDFYLHPTSPSESGFSMDSMRCSSTEMSTNYYNNKSLSTAPVLRRTGSRQYLSNLNSLTSSTYSTATKEPGLKRKSSRINLSLSMALLLGTTFSISGCLLYISLMLFMATSAVAASTLSAFATSVT